ncbi:polar amino acid transport system permease protein [Rhizobium pisi]
MESINTNRGAEASLGLLDGERAWSVGAPPRSSSGWALASILLALFVVGNAWLTINHLNVAADSLGVNGPLALVLFGVIGVATIALLWPASRSWRFAQAAKGSLIASDLVAARVATASSKEYAYYTFGFSAVAALALLFAQFIIANDIAVGHTFFQLPVIFESFNLVLSAFWTNIYIFVVAEILVLIWGLLVAIARLIPGDAARPVRAIATLYTDVFRGMPAIICIYLIGFGIPLTGLPFLKDLQPESYAILALTLTFGAYVAEVYRSGIESIHWSQVAAARSLGLSYIQTLRHVIIPQATKRIIPPLLNDFIALQKDTALVNVIGSVDAFNQAKIIASNHFNLSPVTTVAFLFILITIPQARFVDKLIERDHQRTRAG